MQEQIWHVDENDNPIGSIGREDAREQGARFRIARVSVESPTGRILLQKRSQDKKSYPGYWDTAAGGNIGYGESYDAAATRELQEETGITGVDLQEVAYFYGEAIDPVGRRMNRFTKVYRAIVTENTRLTPDPEEVAELVWVTPERLLTILESNKITDGLKQTADHYYKTSTMDMQ